MRYTRRQFICGSASAFLAGCTRSVGAPRRHVLLGPLGPAEASTVALLRPSSLPTLQQAVRRAVDLAGGFGFIRDGETVLLKPAMNSGNAYPATTDPELLLCVARMIQEAGGQPFVADRTMFLHPTEAAFRKTGIREAAEQARIPCIALEDTPAVALTHPRAAHWAARNIHVYQAVAEADHIVNLCTPRTHPLGDFTMALKNNVGVVQGSARIGMHAGSGLRERIAEISLVVRPSLVILDGRQAFTDGGPDSGALERTDFVAAGRDPLAVDVVGIAELRLAGTKESLMRGPIVDVPMIRRAAVIGVGNAVGDRIRLTGADPQHELAIRAVLS
jgi:uncharacterized protein (DUF362 family)